VLSSATGKDHWELFTNKNYTKAYLMPITYLPVWKIKEAGLLKEADM
jgi:hypothetical protein